jgi:hypothetical protein
LIKDEAAAFVCVISRPTENKRGTNKKMLLFTLKWLPVGIAILPIL